jgi:hypothetical protein
MYENAISIKLIDTLQTKDYQIGDEMDLYLNPNEIVELDGDSQ